MIRAVASVLCLTVAGACQARTVPKPEPVANAPVEAAPEAKAPRPAGDTDAAAAASEAAPRSEPELGPDDPGYSPPMTGGEYDPSWTKIGGYGPYRITDRHKPPLLVGIEYVESSPGGDPVVVGCADGQREGFADVAKFPTIAGCLGSWTTAKSLVDPPTGVSCGDDLGPCRQPADVCAKGWHVCGARADYSDLTTRIGPDECDAAGPGRFNAAVSHSMLDEINPCYYMPPDIGLGCIPFGRGSEPVCCGSLCEFGICKDGVWPGRTRISRGLEEGCQLLSSDRNGGVLCCDDAREPPPVE